MHDLRKHYSMGEKESVTKDHAQCNSASMRCPGLANGERQKAEQWLPTVGEMESVRTMTKGKEVSFLCIQNILELIMAIDTQHYQYKYCRTSDFEYIIWYMNYISVSYFLREESHIKSHHNQNAGNQ